MNRPAPRPALSVAPAPEPNYDLLAELFASAYARTRSIPDALRAVLRAHREGPRTPGLLVVDEVVRAVSRERGVPVAAIMAHALPGAPAAGRAATEARQEAWWRLRQLTPAVQFPVIAARWGVTKVAVLRGVRRHQARVDGAAGGGSRDTEAA